MSFIAVAALHINVFRGGIVVALHIRRYFSYMMYPSLIVVAWQWHQCTLHDVSFSHCCTMTLRVSVGVSTSVITVSLSVSPAAAASITSVSFTWCVLHCCSLNPLAMIDPFNVFVYTAPWPSTRRASCQNDWPDKTFEPRKASRKWFTVLSWHYISFVMW